jgi:alpha-glucosidase
VHDVIAGLRSVVDEFDARVLIGEIYLPFERLVAYYGRDLGGVHLPFNFALLRAPWRARAIAQLIDEYELLLPAGGWPNWVLGNHDSPRIASRVGPDQSRVAAMLLLTLRGTPTIYYGEELGMIQVSVPAERVSDPLERNMPGFGLGRDGARTPMQWDSAVFGGFSCHEPWLPLADDFRIRNVFNQAQNEDSMLTLYRRLISLRRNMPALVIGSYRRLATEGEVLVFLRQHTRESVLVALNFGPGKATVEVGQKVPLGRILLSSGGNREGEPVGGRLELHGNEGLVIAPEADWRG